MLKTIAIVTMLSLSGCTFLQKKSNHVERVGQVDHEIIFTVKTLEPLKNPEQIKATLQADQALFKKTSTISSRTDGNSIITMVHGSLKPDVSYEAAAKRLKLRPSILMVAPNYIYDGDAFAEAMPGDQDAVPEDPRYEDQKHHPIMQNSEAWDIATGEGISVAVTDNGVDLTHDDLTENLWINELEMGVDQGGVNKNSNGIDDDGNGYIDDFRGWDTTSDAGDNDPTNGRGADHGTHVAGIVAATHNEIGVSGTAPESLIVPIRFAGTGSWTSEDVARAYAYAHAAGAKIINTSYNIDNYVTDGVYREAIATADSNGLIVFNSAGNAGRLNPNRQAYQEVILVASTEIEGQVDRKSSFSNYGWGIDIAAPGTDILSVVPGNGYRTMSGTSMAAPNAAAVAALIWSQNPEWTNVQVVAQMFGTADNIDEANDGFVDQLGAGRVNSLRALTETIKAPSIKGLVLEEAREDAQQILVDIQGVLDPKTVVADAMELIRYGDNGDTKKFTLELEYAYKIATNRLTLKTDEPLGKGLFGFTASKALKDPFGTELDGNRDGKSGDDFMFFFRIEDGAASPTQPKTPFVDHCQEEEISDGKFLQGLFTLASLPADADRNLPNCMRVQGWIASRNHLAINSWHINDTIIDDLSTLQFMTHLTSLEIAGHELSDLQSLSYLAKLEQLDLSWNQVADLTILQELPNLKSLNVSWNQLTSTDIFKSNETLEHLNLSGNPIDNVQGLDQMTALQELTLSSMNVDENYRGTLESLQDMGTLQSLTRFRASNNAIKEVAALSSTTTLVNIDLTKNSIEDLSPLKDLTKLQYLFASENPLAQSFCDLVDLEICIEDQQELAQEMAAPLFTLQSHCEDLLSIGPDSRHASKALTCR